MTISGNYSSLVQVNGYACKNCTDVAYAKKHIDPAYPRSGPYDVNAKDDPSRALSDAVEFAGNLSDSISAANSSSFPESLGYSADARSISAALDSGQRLDASV